jgi:hypothetical protein
MKLTLITLSALLALSSALPIPNLPARDFLSDLEGAASEIGSEVDTIASAAASEVDGLLGSF